MHTRNITFNSLTLSGSFIKSANGMNSGTTEMKRHGRVDSQVLSNEPSAGSALNSANTVREAMASRKY